MGNSLFPAGPLALRTIAGRIVRGLRRILRSVLAFVNPPHLGVYSYLYPDPAFGSDRLHSSGPPNLALKLE